MGVNLDHIVVAAATLGEGRAWMEERIGLPPGGGGKHPFMGTENALWRLGQSYLEVIAVDPDAGRPAHPRWFGLDDPIQTARLAERPHLITWVLKTVDIEGLRRAGPIDPGPSVTQTRGDLYWHITIRTDGALNAGGAFPYFIHWPVGVPAPPERLPDQGLTLTEFTCLAPEEGLAEALHAIGASDLLSLELSDGPQRLRAQITTPSGEVVLD